MRLSVPAKARLALRLTIRKEPSTPRLVLYVVLFLSSKIGSECSTLHPIHSVTSKSSAFATPIAASDIYKAAQKFRIDTIQAPHVLYRGR